MIGAGLVALIQAALLLVRRPKVRTAFAEGADAGPESITSSSKRVRHGFGVGYVLYVGGALIMGLLGALRQHMPWYGVVGWCLFAAFAAIVHEVIVGLAAMHSGWFPAFAVTLIFLLIGMGIGLPTIPLAMLVAFCSATGPAFADMGYDLKAGWLLRSRMHPYLANELEGRKQQWYSAMIGFAVALGTVLLMYHSYFDQGLVPPVSKVYVATIKAGLTDPSIWTNLLLWAIPGAIVQLLGGTKRQMGVLLATGLLVTSPNAGWLVIAALIVRVIYTHYRKETAENDLALFGSGVIAGDSLFAFTKLI